MTKKVITLNSVSIVLETVLSLFYTILPVMKNMKKAPGNKAVGKD